MEKTDLEEIPPKEKEPDLEEGDEGELKEPDGNADRDTKMNEEFKQSMERPQSNKINMSDESDPSIDSDHDDEEKQMSKITKKINANVGKVRVHIDEEPPLIPPEGVNLNPKFLKSSVPDKMSERVRAPIYNNDELEEELDLNKRMAFGLSSLRTNMFLYCYR